MNKFEAFNVKSIPHVDNSDTNMLANVASNNDPTHEIFSIELTCMFSILDNEHRIFCDKQQILDFI